MPVACRWPFGSGQIQTSCQAGGMRELARSARAPRDRRSARRRRRRRRSPTAAAAPDPGVEQSARRSRGMDFLVSPVGAAGQTAGGYPCAPMAPLSFRIDAAARPGPWSRWPASSTSAPPPPWIRSSTRSSREHEARHGRRRPPGPGVHGLERAARGGLLRVHCRPAREPRALLGGRGAVHRMFAVTRLEERLAFVEDPDGGRPPRGLRREVRARALQRPGLGAAVRRATRSTGSADGWPPSSSTTSGCWCPSW